MKRCFIFAAGTFYGLREAPRAGDLTIAADAGLHNCRSAGIEGRLMPVPRALTADCGIAWCAPPECRAAIEALLAERGLEYESVCEILI